MNRKRRARECPAFFRARRQTPNTSKGLRRFVRVATSHRWSLGFETQHGPPFPTVTVRHGTPFPTDQNSRTLWLTPPCRLTGQFATGARAGLENFAFHLARWMSRVEQWHRRLTLCCRGHSKGTAALWNAIWVSKGVPSQRSVCGLGSGGGSVGHAMGASRALTSDCAHLGACWPATRVLLLYSRCHWVYLVFTR